MKSKTNKKILISCAVIVIVTSVCLSLILIGGTVISLVWPINFEITDGLLPAIGGDSQNRIDASDPSQTPVDGRSNGQIPDKIAATMQEIEQQVSQLRGLPLIEEVPKLLISPEALQKKVEDEFFADYSDEDARQDVLVFSLLGLIPDDFDLKTFYHELYGEQIAGFYDSETKEIYVVGSSAFTGHEKMTYAHEFTHVLQDQAYGLDDGLGINEEACDEDSERCAAIQALIEGDAMLSEYLWFSNHASRKDQLDIFKMFDDSSNAIFENAPPFFQMDLLFPYDQGFAFVEHLYDQNGFTTIDAAYLTPPLSTEQIMHPERYPADLPQTVELKNLESLLNGNWKLLNQNVMGEWSIYLILSQSYREDYRLTEVQAGQASEGWGGDSYAIYLNEATDEVIFVLDTVWDTLQDADAFFC